MQAKSTIDQVEPARLMTIVASTIGAAILIVAFVVASVGMGTEGQARPGPMPAPGIVATH